MSDRTRRIQGPDWTGDEACYPLQTQEPSASSWGNGFLAGLVHTGKDGPKDTGSFSESIYDLVFNAMGTGVNVGQSSTDTARQTWAAGSGFGYGTGARGDNWSASSGMGFGAGGGVSTFTRELRNNVTGRVDQTQQGVGVAGGLTSHSQNQFSWGNLSANTRADTYVGGGANAYTYRQGDRTGVGGNYNWSVGANNVGGQLAYGQNSASLSAGNVSFAPQSQQASVYRTDGGAVGISRAQSSDDISVSDAKMELRDSSGALNLGVGSFQSGTSFGGGFGAPQAYDLQLGPDGLRGGASYSGGGFRATDVNARRTWNNGNEVHAGAGAIDTNSSYNINGGIGPDGLDLHGGLSQGWRVDNANVGTSGTWGDANLTAGRIQHGTNVTGASVTANGDGLNAGVQQARWGGVQATDMRGSLNAGSVHANLSVGEYANDEVIENARMSLGRDGLQAGADRIELGGQGVKDVNLNGTFGDGGVFGARLGELQNNNTVTGARLDVDGSGLHAGAETASIGGWHLANAGFDASYGDLRSRGSLDSIDTGFQGRGLRADVTQDGIAVGADHAQYDRFRMQNLNLASSWNGVSEQSLRVGDASYNSGSADNIDARIDANGARLSADNARYNYLGANDVHSSQDLFGGAMHQELNLGHGHVHDAGADHLALTADANGVGLSARNAHYSYLGLDNASYSNSYFNGAVGTEASLGRGRYLGASAGELEFQNDLMGNTNLHVSDLNAHGLQLQDARLGTNVGDARASIGADTANALDLNVGDFRSQTSKFGLTGDASVRDANLDVLRLQGAGGNLSYGGQELASARTDLTANLGVGNATGTWDATRGTASGQFENAHLGVMTDNTHLGVGGYGVDLGRTGVNLQASGSGNVDLGRGTASGNVNFAGSELSLFGNSVVAPEWVQASGAVDLSQGAVSANVGGQNGVGADVNLSQGNVDLHVGGYTIDVDEGVRATGEAIATGAGYVADGASYVGGAIADGASAAWDVITSW